MGFLDSMFGGHGRRDGHGGGHGGGLGGGHGNNSGSSHGPGHGQQAPVCDEGRQRFPGRNVVGGGFLDVNQGSVSCAGCKTANAPTARFCQHCGMSMLPTTCKQCGNTLQGQSKYCGQCGTATA